MVPTIQLTQPNNQTTKPMALSSENIKLASQEGEVFEVPHAVAFGSYLVKEMVEEHPEETEALSLSGIETRELSRV